MADTAYMTLDEYADAGYYNHDDRWDRLERHPERLRALADALEREPKKHRQRTWVAERTDCGSTRCAAGHAVAMFVPDAKLVGGISMRIPDASGEVITVTEYSSVKVDGERRSISSVAGWALGLSLWEADEIFLNMSEGMVLQMLRQTADRHEQESTD